MHYIKLLLATALFNTGFYCNASRQAYEPIVPSVAEIALPPPAYQAPEQQHMPPAFVDAAAMQRENLENQILQAIAHIYTDNSIAKAIRAQYPYLSEAQLLQHTRNQKKMRC